jgi:tetraacyldisaccharide 4'-kinase
MANAKFFEKGMMDPIKEAVLHGWTHKNILYYVLLVPLSWLFSLIVKLRQMAYHFGTFKSQAMPVPVIVVGNINIGGSGKTPVVIWLVDQLKKYGFKPAVISRGYGGKSVEPTAVKASSDADLVGDEPLLIAMRTHCPVWVGANRANVAKALLDANPHVDVIVSDDGLQHYALKRIFEIAVVNEDFKADDKLLPAGPLREPVSRLASVDAVICNGADILKSIDHPNGFLMQLKGEQFYNLAHPSISVTVADFKRKTIKAMAGIGKPARFFAFLRGLGLSFSTVSFADHHAFTEADISGIDCDVLIMTEKDAVKCRKFAQKNHWVLPVDVKMDDQLMPLILTKLIKF